MARITLPKGIAGAISIDTDKSRILEGQSFQVDHDQFHHIFGVSCTDRMAAKSLLTYQMAESLLMVQQRITNPLNKACLYGVRVAMRVADGSLVLLVEEQAAAAGATQNGAAALEKRRVGPRRGQFLYGAYCPEIPIARPRLSPTRAHRTAR